MSACAKKSFFCLLSVIAGCLPFMLCERSDVITGAGSSVVTDMDSSLTDMRGFVSANVHKNGVLEAYSLPKTADPAFSTHIAGGTGALMTVGISTEGDTAAAYAEFRAEPFAANADKDPLYNSSDVDTDSLKAFVYLRAENGAPAGSDISVYWCDTLENDLIIRGEKADTLLRAAPVNRKSAIGYLNEQGEPVYDPIGNAEFDSIQLPDSVAKEIFRIRTTSEDPNALYKFAIGIFDYHGELRRVRVPYVIMRVKKYGSSTAIRDSIPGMGRFSVFESSEWTERAELPYSSQLTKRTAVIKVDVGSILNTLSNHGLIGGCELINAMALVALNRDSTIEMTLGNYRFLALDTLISNDAPNSVDGFRDTLSLRDRFAFAPSGATAPTRPFNAHSMKAPLWSLIEKHAKGGENQFIYIYLRASGDNVVMQWDKDSDYMRIETVFIPSRNTNNQGK